ncbi:MAG TPA: protein-L-isoaspartate O-methyltransferase [Candidatus Dojkabacteria bacterium]|jgi:protein-L-isoaspartate(D-aspartate) O-methyltransferase
MDEEFNLDKFGGSSVFRWTHENMLRVLTTGHNRVVNNERLIQALRIIKREDFVPDTKKENAYEDKELDIGFNQNLTRPTTVAHMIELAEPKVGSKVLDIGTGSGWSTALFAYVVGNRGKVVSIEKLQYLLDFARKNIAKYPQFKNIELVFRDGYLGLPERGPFDVIHASASYEKIPEELKAQINIGGRLVAPTKQYKIIVVTREDKDTWNEKYYDNFILDEMTKGVNL